MPIMLTNTKTLQASLKYTTIFQVNKSIRNGFAYVALSYTVKEN